MSSAPVMIHCLRATNLAVRTGCSVTSNDLTSVCVGAWWWARRGRGHRCSGARPRPIHASPCAAPRTAPTALPPHRVRVVVDEDVAIVQVGHEPAARRHARCRMRPVCVPRWSACRRRCAAPLAARMLHARTHHGSVGCSSTPFTRSVRCRSWRCGGAGGGRAAWALRAWAARTASAGGCAAGSRAAGTLISNFIGAAGDAGTAGSAQAARAGQGRQGAAAAPSSSHARPRCSLPLLLLRHR